MTLQASIHPVSHLPESEVERMFALMDAHYENVTPDGFRRDLAAKRWTILLRDKLGILQGFSSLQLFTLGAATYLYSGDTIVNPEHWLDGGLVGAFGHVLLRLFEEFGEERLYWFLLSKGFRTYRLLPLHFLVYIPGVQQVQDPELLARRDALAAHLFGSAYEIATGRVLAHPGKDRLRPKMALIPEHRQHDRHVAFFLEHNPGFAQGDELACLVPLSRANLTPMAWRQIRHTHARWEDPA
jgi:hypothetical protein